MADVVLKAPGGEVEDVDGGVVVDLRRVGTIWKGERIVLEGDQSRFAVYVEDDG